MLDLFRRALTQLGEWAATPAAFLFVAAFTCLWYVVEQHTLDWHGIATLLTLVIALLINRATYRDSQALHAKLDELIQAMPNARDAMTAIDRAEPEDIERHRDRQPNKR